MKVLYASPDHSQIAKLIEVFKNLKMELTLAVNGKETQTKLAENDFSAVILDNKLTNHSFLLVIKFCKIKCPKVIILLKSNTEEELKKLELSESDIKALGISLSAVGPTWIEKTAQYISKNAFNSWQNIEETYTESEVIDESALNDKLFTQISIDNFLGGRPAIFDIFIRLGQNKYIRILNKGAIIDPVRIKNYKKKYSLTYLYFKTDERIFYINYINTMIEKSCKDKSLEQKLDLIGGASQKYLEEIQVQGLNPLIYEEGVRLANNTLEILSNMSSINSALEKLSKENISHQFLATIYAVSIAKNIDWAGKKTLENILMGCLIHDIGLVRLKCHQKNPNFKVSELSKSELEEYKSHPSLGYELLKTMSHIPEAVKQIVLQHHENIDGSGYPNGLSSQKIYPLAKIVNLANYFATLVQEEGLTPIEALRKFIPNTEETKKFDPIFIKALIKGFF